MSNTVQNYTGKYIAASISAVATSEGAVDELTLIRGLADINIEWTRPIQMTKMLDEAAPVLIKGKTSGKIVLQGFAAAGVTAVGATAQFTTDNVPKKVTVTLEAVDPVKSVTSTVEYVGFLTGKGMQFRQLAPRMWVMDGTTIISLID